MAEERGIHTSADLKANLKAQALALGFDLTGIAAPVPSSHGTFYREWLARGYAAGMGYLARPDAVARRLDVRRVLPAVRSVIVVAQNYYLGDFPAASRRDPARGLIARYAWGQDYHHVMLPRLKALARWLQETVGRRLHWRAYVDVGPVLEREWAVRAGLGFIGHNTHLIHPQWGSYLFLGVLLVDVGLPPDEPLEQGGCGRCRRCLEACPTGALVAPHTLDARRCRGYLSIEHRGPFPDGMGRLLGRWVFGCDVCQEVCPWNQRFARPTRDLAFQRRVERAPLLQSVLDLTPAAFEERYGATPVERAGLEGLQRNARAILGASAENL